ncbi:hypothetical protein V5O48_001040 [Marasmius crinis-equi]|uniref:Uncharacterized protein n=1 Tax=Marasmius crinis-equi TaxID=585013 RepID=A0ABR3FZK0_9AGAR
MNPSTTQHLAADSRHIPLAELDSFSDSDWLDIASGRESDTDDSLDHVDTTSASLSRRSSFSTGSSRDGEVDAWEGFVEEAPEVSTVTGTNRMPSVTPVIEEEHPPEPLDPEADRAEDRRVMVGLEQSLISTLSASRSSSLNSTVHNSLRDLRLSFPDPLTSSNDELHSLYDRSSTPPLVEEVSSADVTITDDTTVSIPVEDPGLLPTPEVIHQEEALLRYADATSDVVLYGSRSPQRWALVHDLLTKAAAGSGRVLDIGQRVNDEIEHVRILRKFYEAFPSRSQYTDTLIIQDRTDDSSLPSSESIPSRPSLAIVLLPCNPASIPLKHTSYLPLIASGDQRDDAHEATTSLQAQIAWAQCHVPDGRVVRLEDSGSPLTAKRMKELNPVHVYRALRLFTEKPSKRGGIQAITIFALLSLIIGFSVNTVLRAHSRGLNPTISSSRGDIPSTKASVVDNAIVNSTALAARITSDLFVVPPSLSSAPPAYERGSTAPGAVVSTSIISSTKAVANIPNTIKSLTEKVKSSKDVTVRSPSTTSTESSYTNSPVASTSNAYEEEPQSSAVTVKLVDSLSEIVEVTVKALIEVVHHDFAELLLAVDELVASIRRRSRIVVEQSRNTVHVVREQLQYRNERAKNKARELTEKGFRLMSYAGNAFAGRTYVARKRAQSLKEGVAGSDAWGHYSKAQGEWSEALGREARGRRGHRCHPVQGARQGAACH